MRAPRLRHESLITASLFACLLLALAPWPGLAQTAAWEQREGYRVARLPVPVPGRTGFSLLPPAQTGVWFTNQLSYNRSETNQNLLNGAGVAAGDFDGDGWCDLYFCNLEGPNALFRNTGKWQFTNVTASAGAECARQCSRGAVLADVSGDGRLDLLVSALGGSNACLVNLGNGRFQDVTHAAGFALKSGGQGLTLADIDNDGDLDVYLANYGENSILRSGGMISVRQVGGKATVTGRHANRLKIIGGQLMELGEPDVLYLNDGQGRFSAVSWTDGTFRGLDGNPLKAAPWDLGLSAIFRDINGDTHPDLYVCNDFQTPDRIWLNDGKGRFHPLPEKALRTTCHFSMGVDFADVNRDGLDDFFVTDMLSQYHELRMRQIGASNPPPEQVGENLDRHQIHRNTLYVNRGDGTYAEIANFARVDSSDWTWSVIFLDVDLDGYEDILNSNGHAYDTQDLDMHEKMPASIVPVAGGGLRRGKNLKDYPALRTPNVLFRNRGDLTFEEVGKAWGFDSLEISHGIAMADLDNDGDLDLAVNCLWAPPLIYRNETTAPRVAVRLKGLKGNRQGYGAKITVRGGPVPIQTQEMVAGGRYLSGDEALRVFAAGSLTNRLTIEVTWRSGKRSVVANALPNHLYEIDEAAAVSAPLPTPTTAPAPLFQDVSRRLGHRHSDPPFNDLERQPLLHRMLSSLGPGVAWFDLDGDKDDDLVIGAGKDSPLAVYRNDGQGNFTPWPAAAWKAPSPDDLGGVLGWPAAGGGRALLASLANYESPESTAGTVLQFNPDANSPALPVAKLPKASAGALAAADLEGDGDLDLFVGGRVLPGRYPEAAESLIYRNQGGTLQADPEAQAALRSVGLVSGAVFSDLNGDGLPELVLACEWGPVRVFQNAAGRLREITRETGLEQFHGWWNGVTTGDLDGDGRMDIIAANWGLNSSYYQPTPEKPLRLYYADFDGNSSLDLIEALTDSATGRIVPRRDMLFISAGLPTLRSRFASHQAYSKAAVSDMIEAGFARTPCAQATTLASMVFLNRGNRFEAVPLPVEAQWAPAFGLNVTDLDGDGTEDVFLAQNYFAMRLEEPRLDSGRGLLLRGLGAGKLAAMPGQHSGILIYGEQRGSACGDFDGDGRTDLVVTQNRSETRLLKNAGAKPGIRVRLAGPPGNPEGVGAVIRILQGDRQGPAREVHAGSGYYSQDSAVQVMAASTGPAQVWVRWPGGRVTTTPITPNAREVVVPMAP